MSKTLKLAALAALMTMVLGLMALPAMAFDTVTFTGTAQVCAETVEGKGNAPGCDDPKKKNGLYAPGGDVPHRVVTDESKYTDRYGNWSFESVTCSKINVTGGDTGPVPCTIQASGELAPVADMVGAACGVSQGRNGTGTYTAENGTTKKLRNVGWVTSAGGTLPVTADYYDATKKGDKPSTGRLAGAVQAQGGAPCVKSAVTGKAGASQFVVVGTFEQLP